MYLVGDPKQAIYSFRGADIHVYYQAAKELMDAGGIKVTLDTNYRSSSSMVDLFNTGLCFGILFLFSFSYQSYM